MRWMAALPLLFLVPLATVGAEGNPRVGLRGYDPVAYFTQHKPAKGVAGIAFDWDGTRYHFASARHRDTFAADPERYAPRFSGHCTGAILKGTRYEADPEAWAIVDGRLYLFSSTAVRARIEAEPGSFARAEESWRRMR